MTIYDIPCPVCGGPWPWLWMRDSVTGKLVGCTHDIVFVTDPVFGPPPPPHIVMVP